MSAVDNDLWAVSEKLFEMTNMWTAECDRAKALESELSRVRLESAALAYIVSRWRTQIGPPDPVWHLMHDVHMMRPDGCVDYVVERCAALAAKPVLP